MTPPDLSAFSLWDLFRTEIETQITALTTGLLALERNPADVGEIPSAMRAAHSIKGAARIVQLDSVIRVAHAVEDCLVAAQEGRLILDEPRIDVLLAAVDALTGLSRVEESAVDAWVADQSAAIDQIVADLDAIRAGTFSSPAAVDASPAAPAEAPAEAPDPSDTLSAAGPPSDRGLRVTAEALSNVMNLAGEMVVTTKWLESFGESLVALKTRQSDLAGRFDHVDEQLTRGVSIAEARATVHEMRRRVDETRQALASRVPELESYALRAGTLAERLYGEAQATRMRPFGDGVHAFPRLVRDLAKQLGKKADLTITGRATPVDRDILEKLETPLNHMIRNALDHGLEQPDERVARGKPPAGTVHIEATHRAGLLLVVVSDDGRGVDLERLREKIVARGIAAPDFAAQLSEAELLEFLFLPGFSTTEGVTDISGRGVGLDAVQNMTRDVGGTVRAMSRPGRGLTIQLELPLTLSVLRALVVEIAGDPFALPLTRIDRLLSLSAADVHTTERWPYTTLDGQRLDLVRASDILELSAAPPSGDQWPVVMVSDRGARFGIIVDRFVGEHTLVVRPLDPALGRVPDISAAAVFEDGSTGFILDVDDVVRSIEHLVVEGCLRGTRTAPVAGAAMRRKRVLVVDDSATVRVIERRMLEGRGYDVDVAVDGVDGWNTVRTGSYDLVLTDVDMPRMDGIELVTRIRADPTLAQLPVMIVSYKDRDVDRQRGLDAGANNYVSKSRLQDQALLDGVAKLLGDAGANA